MQEYNVNSAFLQVDLLSGPEDGPPQAPEVIEPIHAHCYCPAQLLCAFTLLMAGHGRCVNSSMMLGDRSYALWHLARAHTMGDRELRFVAAKLFAYFDADDGQAPAGLHA